MNGIKAAFFHDGPTYTCSGNYYACVLNDKLIERYFYFSKNLTIVNRLREVPRLKTDQLELITSRDTRIIEIPNLATLKGLIFNYIKSQKIIDEEVKKADIVIARLPSIAGGFAIKYAQKHSKPYFIEVVGCTWDALRNYGFRGKLIAPFMYFWMKKLIFKAPFALYVTNQFLQNRYPNNNVSEGISDVSLPEINSSLLDIRKRKLNARTGPLIVATLAGVDLKYKGQKHVIKAIAILAAEGFEIEYRLIGGGDNSRLSELAKKLKVSQKIKFLGALPHEKIFNELDQIDIYIQPSETEGMPRALIEAMSRACPCIGSKVGGIPELIDQEFLFRAGDYKTLAKILSSFNKERMILQSEVNYRKSLRFMDSTLTQRRIAFYDHILKNNNQIRL